MARDHTWNAAWPLSTFATSSPDLFILFPPSPFFLSIHPAFFFFSLFRFSVEILHFSFYVLFSLAFLFLSIFHNGEFRLLGAMMIHPQTFESSSIEI